MQETVDRISAQAPPERTWVITGAAYADETRHQLPELPANHIIGEPCRRDTAPCVGLGAALIARDDPDATIIVMPADHVIEPVQEFRRAVHAAEQFANDNPGSLLTFGIPPTFPSTGYGYIRVGANAGTRQDVPANRVSEFKEKPDAETAERVCGERRISVEQRHLRLEARGDPRGIASSPPGHSRRCTAHRRGPWDIGLASHLPH